MDREMPRKYNHVHKLQLHKYKNGTTIYFCILNCSFKIDPALALGKESICHKCGNIFTMSPYSIKLKFPHCENCKAKQNKSNKIIVGNADKSTHDESDSVTAEIELKCATPGPNGEFCGQCSICISRFNDSNPVSSMINRMRQTVKFETIKEEDLL